MYVTTPEDRAAFAQVGRKRLRGDRARRRLDDHELLVQELRTLVQSRLARFKQPKAYVFMPALPRNPSGKIIKRMLREQSPGPAPE